MVKISKDFSPGLIQYFFWNHQVPFLHPAATATPAPSPVGTRKVRSPQADVLPERRFPWNGNPGIDTAATVPLARPADLPPETRERLRELGYTD